MEITAVTYILYLVNYAYRHLCKLRILSYLQLCVIAVIITSSFAATLDLISMTGVSAACKMLNLGLSSGNTERNISNLHSISMAFSNMAIFALESVLTRNGVWQQNSKALTFCIIIIVCFEVYNNFDKITFTVIEKSRLAPCRYSVVWGLNLFCRCIFKT